MTEREEFEAVAKLVEIEVYGWPMEDPVCFCHKGTTNSWNPKENDGDSFRLMVKLKFKIDWDGDEVQVFEEMYDSGNPVGAVETSHALQNPRAATRLAIWRAAVEMAKGEKK